MRIQIFESLFFAKNTFMNKSIAARHQIGFLINVQIIIPEDDTVRLLYEVTEGLDYSCLYKNYSTIGRNPAIAPSTLFRILVYGYQCIHYFILTPMIF